MIRFTWLQFRTQAAIATGALIVIAVVLAVTGHSLVDLYRTTVAPCGARGNCPGAESAFLQNDRFLQEALPALLVIVPALIGIFWGSPLVARELESGTFRLAWTQSITRQRWLAAKLGVIGLSGIAVAGLLSLMVTWWSNPIDLVTMNKWAVFQGRGVVPIAYAAFGFVLGVTAGVLTRRTLPAMAITLPAFAIARLAVTGLRPHLQAPLTAIEKFTVGTAQLRLMHITHGHVTESLPGSRAAPPHPGDWVLSSNTLTSAGRPVNLARLTCAYASPNRPRPRSAMSKAAEPCIAHIQAYISQLREFVTYQPAKRYWPFQWYETAIFLGLALALAGVCFWWIRRRIA